MATKYVKVGSIPMCLKEGKKYQVELIDNEVVVSKEVRIRDWENVTSLCHPEFRPSQHYDGRYLVLMYCGKPAVVIGTRGMIAQKGFKVDPAPNAYTSFQVWKKCS